MLSLVYQWIDLFWLAMVFIAADRRHWIFAAGFVLSCVFMLRLQVELLESIGYPTGIFPFMEAPIFQRGLVVYGVIYMLYFLLTHFSRGSKGVVVLAASISVFFFALILSLGVMVL